MTAIVYAVVQQSCSDCMGDDGPEVEVYSTRGAADERASKWWGGICGRTYVTEVQMDCETTYD